jgi:hypothetical protein
MMILCIPFLLAAPPAASVPQHRPAHQFYCLHAEEQGSWFDFQSKGPIDLIEFLKKEFRPGGMNFITMSCYHLAWVQKEDLPALKRLLGSKERCAAVVASVDSNIPWDGTNVGDLAQELLNSYNSGGFPQSLEMAIRLTVK